MRKIYLLDMGLLVVAGTMAAVLTDEPVHPPKLSTADIAGEVFDRPEMTEHTENSNATLGVASPQE
ncbi:MAG: hypothetical protein GY783_20145 [Gammaproteobacteria bacterium]|nr:hypothetical protein [Gammaproteobacteria bacterium]